MLCCNAAPAQLTTGLRVTPICVAKHTPRYAKSKPASVFALLIECDGNRALYAPVLPAISPAVVRHAYPPS